MASLVLFAFSLVFFSLSILQEAAVPPPLQVLVLQWPISVCKYYACNLQGPLPPSFTLHGVWPVDASMNSITCQPQPFGTLDNQLVHELDFIWPSYTGPNINFWRHEWRVHGSCSGATFSDYFQCAADNGTLYSEDVWFSLALPQIYPSDQVSYTVQSIFSAIAAKILVRPHLRCKYKGHRRYLLEVGICLSGNFQNVIDCPVSLSGCGSPTSNIYFPDT